MEDRLAVEHACVLNAVLASRLFVAAVFAISLISAVGSGHFRYEELAEEANGTYAAALASDHLSHAFFIYYFLISEALVALAFAVTGLIIVWRARDRVATLGAVALMLYGVTLPPPMHALVVVVPPLPTLLLLERSLGIGLFIVFLYVFPEDKLTWWTKTLCVAVLAWTAMWSFVPGTNPYMFPRPWAFLTIAALFGSGLAVQYWWFRHAAPAQKQQTKWVTYALTASVLGDLITHLPWEIGDLHPGGDLTILLLHQPFFVAAQLAVPLAIAFSILYFHLWEIDFIVSRTLIYGAVTSLAAVTWEIVNMVVTRTMNAEMGSQGAAYGAASATIVTGLALKPAYDKLKAYIDKRFSPQTLDLSEEFPELDPVNVARVPVDCLLTTVVNRLPPLFESTSAVIWLSNGSQTFADGASAGVTQAQVQTLTPTASALDDLRAGKTVRIGGAANAPVLVPLVLPRKQDPDLIGVLALGDRASEKGYSQLELGALVDLGKKLGTALYVAQVERHLAAPALIGNGDRLTLPQGIAGDPT